MLDITDSNSDNGFADPYCLTKQEFVGYVVNGNNKSQLLLNRVVIEDPVYL
ncbi:hypothetical protein DSL72_006234 [Monilinia vaccinii-corymbosi]|uniref:Uncharacterized protein n=1 Tax=Monilinia vaccinii-corymbosi TaxID=61207 RepID=A0A8A3PLX4_9HELO|nr:hypothetical protein DSL72_006234 [Monilinia vaccinii-corymbosi]